MGAIKGVFLQGKIGKIGSIAIDTFKLSLVYMILQRFLLYIIQFYFESMALNHIYEISAKVVYTSGYNTQVLPFPNNNRKR